jgi:hypothetical protein
MVQDLALGMRRARVVVDAGIDTLHIDASVIARTVAIAVAANNPASIQRIAMVAFAAMAVSHVVVREALGVGAARVCDQARVYAVVVLTGLIDCTLTVVLALNRIACDFRVALVALLARADRLVVPYVADGVGPAIARIATLSIDAGVVVAAIVVDCACPDNRQLYCGIERIYELCIYCIYLLSDIK